MAQACRDVFVEANLDATCEFVHRAIGDMGGMLLRKGQLLPYTKWYGKQRGPKDARPHVSRRNKAIPLSSSVL